MTKVLVTGGSGYIGTQLTQMLMRNGYDVTNIDTQFYNGILYHGISLLPKTVVKDIRHLTLEDLDGFDAVVLAADLSNDPIAGFVGNVTLEVNHGGNSHVARLAKQAGIPRLVYLSSTSVYGVADDWVDETSPVNPQTPYAEAKVLTEGVLRELADDGFAPVALRNSTTHGASPAQRLDIVVPDLSALAFTTGKIAMTSDGSPWRPLVHILDTCQAVLLALRAPAETVGGQVFNIGPMDEHGESLNYRVRDVAEIVGGAFPGCGLTFGKTGIGADNRSYRVKFDKIRDQLGFVADYDIAYSAAEMRQVFEQVGFTKDRLDGREFIRLNQIRWLLDTGQIDEKLFWK